MDISELMERLSEALEAHGDMPIRTVLPQHRTTPELELRGGFIDSEGLVLVMGGTGDYFSTDEEESYSYAQMGDWEV